MPGISFLSSVMNLGRKTVVNFSKRVAVETSKVLQGKVNVQGFNVSDILHSPQADEFIASAAKQKANILSDSIVRFADRTMPYRVVTKRLPSGTTVTHAFDTNGLSYKEVISKNGRAISNSANDDIHSNVSLVYNYAKDYCVYKPLHFTAADATYIPYARQVSLSDHFLNRPNGMTALSNANNENYQTLLKMGMIYK